MSSCQWWQGGEGKRVERTAGEHLGGCSPAVRDRREAGVTEGTGPTLP